VSVLVGWKEIAAVAGMTERGLRFALTSAMPPPIFYDAFHRPTAEVDNLRFWATQQQRPSMMAVGADVIEGMANLAQACNCSEAALRRAMKRRQGRPPIEARKGKSPRARASALRLWLQQHILPAHAFLAMRESGLLPSQRGRAASGKSC
jgi:hypothetical protein